MLGAKLVQRFGSTSVFRVVVAVFGIGQVLMVFSPTASVMLCAQGLVGLAAAVIVPALVALIANHYPGQQQATAVGALGSARAAAGVLAFLIGGMLGTFIGWRPVFALLVAVCGLVFVLSPGSSRTPSAAEVNIDMLGVLLAAASIIMITMGFNNLNRWGLGAARPAAPFTVLGLSPAPLMIVLGIGLLQAFIAWTRRVQASGGTPLLDLRVITSNRERAAVICMFSVVALEAMLNFSVPLYIQIVQGNTPIATAIAMLPFNLTVFFTAMLVVRLYPTLTPRVIGMLGFMLCTVALLWLAWVMRNDWGAPVVMTGLILFGIGQGALVTLVFNVLVSAAPKELAGDVGSLRGTAQNLAAGVGTAVAGALLVGLLSGTVLRALVDHPQLPPEVQAQVDLDSINFVSNNQLRGTLERTTSTAEQVEAAIDAQHRGAAAGAQDGPPADGVPRLPDDPAGESAARLPARRDSRRAAAGAEAHAGGDRCGLRARGPGGDSDVKRIRIIHDTAYHYREPVTFGPHRAHDAAARRTRRPHREGTGRDRAAGHRALAARRRGQLGGDHHVRRAREEASRAGRDGRRSLRRPSHRVPHRACRPVVPLPVRARRADRARAVPAAQLPLRRSGAAALAARPLQARPGRRHLRSVARPQHAHHEALRYEERHDPGVQVPHETLQLGSGSCRDYAVLMMEAARHWGFGARFVTGYIQLGEGQHGATHAWTEVYLPGAGWHGFDPTNNKLAGTEHISVAVAREQEKASPLAGTWSGPANAFERMEVSLQVVAL